MRTKKILLVILALLGIALIACHKEKEIIPRMALDKSYTVTRLQPFRLKCNLGKGSYEWKVIELENATNQTLKQPVLSNCDSLYAVFEFVGTYTVRFRYQFGENAKDTLSQIFRVYVNEEASAYSPFVSDVLQYNPAPGKYVNERLELAGNSENRASQATARCRSYFFKNERLFKEAKLSDEPKTVSLGAFGGYIVMAFDHMVKNEDGEDFLVYGYTRGGDRNKEYIFPQPGVVFVSFDANANGEADDEWYLLDGGKYQSTTPGKGPEDTPQRNCSVIYSSPENAEVKPNEQTGFSIEKYIQCDIEAEGNSVTEYIAQLTNDYEKNQAGSYWPEWESGKMTFGGSDQYETVRLPNNGVEKWNHDHSLVEQTEWTWNALEARYANTVVYSKNKGFDISKAVDRAGNPVHLPGIHFVRVQTGVCQQIPQKGPSETEVAGASDLRMLKAQLQKKSGE